LLDHHSHLLLGPGRAVGGVDEFLYASAFVSSSAEKTVSVGVPTELVLGDVFHWQELLQ
jgi:hypothetical protein